MNQDTQHRWRFRGICSDADALGVGREHLYKVLAGKRPGKSLRARYDALKTAQRVGTVSASAGRDANPPKPAPGSIFTQERSPCFSMMVASLGIGAIIVVFEPRNNPPPMSRLLCQERLTTSLTGATSGNYECTFFEVASVWHCFRAANLAKAMRALRDQIEALGLLDIALILHVDTADKLRCWFSSRPEDLSREITF